MCVCVCVYVCSVIFVEQLSSKTMQPPLGTWYLPQSHKEKYTVLSQRKNIQFSQKKEDNRQDAHEITEQYILF